MHTLGAECEIEVDAVVRRGEVAARQLLDPPEAVAERVDVDMQRGGGLVEAPAEVEERAQRVLEIGAVAGVVVPDRPQDGGG